MDKIEQDLFLSRAKKEYLETQYHKLFDDYVLSLANVKLKERLLIEAGEVFKQKEEQYIQEIETSAKNQMELAIKVKHLSRELEAWEKGKKTTTPARKKRNVHKASE